MIQKAPSDWFVAALAVGILSVIQLSSFHSLNERAHLLTRVFRKTPSSVGRSNSVQQTVSRKYHLQRAQPTSLRLIHHRREERTVAVIHSQSSGPCQCKLNLERRR